MMTIDDRDCPNCGAPVDFAGGSRATCSFCKSQLYLTDEGVKASSVLNDLLKNPPERTVTSTTYRPPRMRSSTLGCLFGCLPALLFIGVCAGFIMLSSQIMFRAFGPLDHALQIVNSNPAVVQAFGEPITPGAFVTGSISGGDSSSSARFNVPIYGPKRSGELSVSGSWRKGVWDLSIWVTHDDDGEERTIYLTQKVK